MVKIHQISTAISQVSERINPLSSQPMTPSGKPSMLEKFSVDFEYNKTLQEIKRDVRVRTHKAS